MVPLSARHACQPDQPRRTVSRRLVLERSDRLVSRRLPAHAARRLADGVQTGGLCFVHRHELQIECVQQPGEVIFVPHGWWHVVLNMNTTVAVTQNYCAAGNLPHLWPQLCDKRPDFARYWIDQMTVSIMSAV